ncbi:hypothetical protein HPB51_012648 [Rhipicephalus microplus]|uniref:Uncharacterized protein n=1 Tax=Rhipicephalus microplus TaxID=6941 RepID=A0A9J6E144_RHIMP|nr:hypothetical protein HPB51_012648 [Rhipicephalus microplus]
MALTSRNLATLVLLAVLASMTAQSKEQWEAAMRSSAPEVQDQILDWAKRCISTSKKNYWTIHGLWPAGDNTSPSFCVDEQFNGRVLDWQKHGTCAGDVPALNGLFKFFNSTLAVYKKYNIFEFLSNSLIRPSVVRTYSAAEIRNALSDDIRQKVNIVCSQRVPNRDAPVLTEIRFCLDKNLEPVNCQGKNGGCGRRNYYLPSRP